VGDKDLVIILLTVLSAREKSAIMYFVFNRKYQNIMHATLRIIDLRIKGLFLYQKAVLIKNQLIQQEIIKLDKELILLLKNYNSFDFIKQISQGPTLLVGEGNMSFIKCLTKRFQKLPYIVTSTYEKYDELSTLGQSNAKHLRQLGIEVYHELDATKLHEVFSNLIFNTIIFQFPNSGSRESENGTNSNYNLVSNFIKSATKILRQNGSILITTVDSDYYNNIFKFDEIAELQSLQKPIKYSFNPQDYEDYQHTMTNEDKSAIEEYDNFITWEFKL